MVDVSTMTADEMRKEVLGGTLIATCGDRLPRSTGKGDWSTGGGGGGGGELSLGERFTPTVA